jgi:hypothetical protein
MANDLLDKDPDWLKSLWHRDVLRILLICAAVGSFRVCPYCPPAA